MRCVLIVPLSQAICRSVKETLTRKHTIITVPVENKFEVLQPSARIESTNEFMILSDSEIASAKTKLSKLRI